MADTTYTGSHVLATGSEGIAAAGDTMIIFTDEAPSGLIIDVNTQMEPVGENITLTQDVQVIAGALAVQSNEKNLSTLLA